MKGIKNLTVAALLGLGTLTAVGTAQAAPNRGHDNRDDHRTAQQVNRPASRPDNHPVFNNGHDNRPVFNSNGHDNRPGWDNGRDNRPVFNNGHENRPAWNGHDNDFRPGGGYDAGRGYNSGDLRQFSGYAVATNSSGSLMQVRGDNGTTYTVRSTAYIQAGQRVQVSGYLYNGVIENASVSRF